MKKNVVYLLSAILAVFLTAGCADNVHDVHASDAFEAGEGKALMAFSIDGATSEGTDIPEQESRIDHVYLLFYAVDANLEREVPLAAARAEVSVSDPGALMFRMPLRLIPDTDYKVLAIANADSFTPEGFNDFSEYLESWGLHAADPDAEGLHLYHSDPILGLNETCLPMCGRTAGDAFFRYTMQNGRYNVSVSLTFRRLVARIDVVNAVEEGFEVEGVALCNWRDAVSITNPDGQPGGGSGTVCGRFTEEREDADEAGMQIYGSPIYCFPSACEDTSSFVTETTALIIKARYGNDAEPSYYRVNVGNSGDRTEVRANARYTVTVLSVKGRGASSAREAYESDGSQIEQPPYVPVIPTDKPFALIPVTGERVSIDHDARTIEIDAFDPDCFNSFIDIPFTVYVNATAGKNEDLLISSDLEATLEGWVSKEKHDHLCYCSNSFVSTGTNALSVYSKTEKKELPGRQVEGFNRAFNCSNGDVVYISVGAMGPDDPAIVKTVSLSIVFEKIDYKLTIRPRPAIMDDVVLTDGAGNTWLIQDRNLQNLDNDYSGTHIGRTPEGEKRQAYNFISQFPVVSIPGKYVDALKNPMNEGQHTLYEGYDLKYSRRSELQSGNSSNSRKAWLGRYVHTAGQTRRSPFYESDNHLDWNFPSGEVLNLCAEKMRASKMRMYLVSDIPAKEGKNIIPVCCYWPFSGNRTDDPTINNITYGYYAADGSGNVNPMGFFFCNKDEIVFTLKTSSLNGYYGFSRLARPLTLTELESYKTGFLGYGPQPHRLTVCHPDTYDSTSLGWFPY